MTPTDTVVSEERLREILDGCEGVQGGPWRLDEFACFVWAPSEKGGEFPIMDDLAEFGRVGELRGWGHYTGSGHGALGLPADEAKERQRLTGKHNAAAQKVRRRRGLVDDARLQLSPAST